MKHARRIRDDFSIALDPASSLSLQHQVRQKIVDSIHHGLLRPARRLPSSRRLAESLGVSRNTVSLAYDALLAEGFLVSRARSGIFVASDAPGERIATGRRGPGAGSRLTQQMPPPPGETGFRCPVNWHQYPFPFVDGRISTDLLPLAEWREAIRLACARHEAARWNAVTGDADDPMLLDEVRSKILSLRGMDVGTEEMLMMVSQRYALCLVVELLVRRATPVVVEEPCEAELLRQLNERQAEVSRLDPGLAAPLPQGAIVFTGLRRWHASTAAWQRGLLAAVAAADGILVELDVPPDVRDASRTQPALRALDVDGRVVYIGTLAAVAACGDAPGIVVAGADLIERVRQSRRNHGATLSPQSQRSWAYFIGLGHYSSALLRAGRVLEKRRRALRDALNHYLHRSTEIRNLPGASAYWVSVPEGIDGRELAQNAAASGILLELAPSGDGGLAFYMGVTGLHESQIRAGVLALSRLLRERRAPTSRRIEDESVAPLRGAALRKAMSDATLLYNTVYGEPATLRIHRDGKLSGVAGYAGEDCDEGRWWIENDRWFRQWQQWAYGEASNYAIVIDGDQLRWYDADGALADSAVIVRKPARRKIGN